MSLLGADKSHPWPIDGTEQSWSFAGAAVAIAIEDELGKVDLNAAPEIVLRCLLRVEGVAAHEAEILADVVADWRDPGDLKRLNGASIDDYRRAGFPYAPRKAPFESVGELGQVMGMSEDLLERLRPALTVFSRRPSPVPGAAPRPVAGVVQGSLPGAPGTMPAALSGVSTVPRAASMLVPDPTGRAFTITARACRTARRRQAARSSASAMAGEGCSGFMIGDKYNSRGILTISRRASPESYQLSIQFKLTDYHSMIEAACNIKMGARPRSSSRPSCAEEHPMPNARALMEKIQALPPERLGEVEDFVDFLAAKTRRLAALDRLLAIAPALEAAGVPPMTEDEIQAEVDAVRSARRSRGGGADRS